MCETFGALKSNGTIIGTTKTLSFTEIFFVYTLFGDSADLF